MRILVILGLLSAVLAAETPDREEVWRAVERAGLPATLVRLEESRAFPEVVMIGRQNPDQTYSLNAVFLKGQYLTPAQATREQVSQFTVSSALDWVTQVLLAFEQPCLHRPPEFEGSSDYLQPFSEADGAGGFRVRLWVRGGREFTLRQYHLTASGFRLTIQQRRPLSQP